MDQAGARTQLPSLVAAAGTLLLLIFGTALLEDIPSPAIGAIVAVAVFPLLGIPKLAALWRQDRFEFAVAAVCFLGAVLIGPIAGIGIAFVLAVVNVVRRAANPPIDVLEADGDPHASLLDAAPDGVETAPGVVVVRLAAPLFFANSGAFGTAVRRAVEASHPAHLVLDLEAVTDVDVTGADAWSGIRSYLAANGADLSVSRVRPGIRERLERLGLLDGVRFFDTNRAAIAALTMEGAAHDR
jgi:MFS superfamily sulfate permease-like transporter